MPQLIITRGLPGSGKSTWAKKWVATDRQNRVRINRDDLRDMVDDGVWINKLTEPRIVSIRDAAILASLKKGRSVVVDDTNLDTSTVKALRKLAERANAFFGIEDFTWVPVESCIERDATREGNDRVGEEVIIGMYNKYIRDNKFAIDNQEEYSMRPYTGIPFFAPMAVIVDIDGTIASMNGRSPYDYTKVSQDTPKNQIIWLVNTLINKGVIPLFTSGRPDSCEQDTLDWLDYHIPSLRHRAYEFRLLMRTIGDNRPDWIIKYELFDKHIRDKYNVLMVLDDRNQVVEMWRKIGLTCLQVAEGDF